MITSSSISYISEMLEHPQNLTEADEASIKELTQAFPYFVPARYMQAAQEHKESRFQPEMVSRMELFSGNWMFYNQFLQDSIGGEEAVFTAPELITEPEANTDAATVADETKVDTNETVVEEEVEEEIAPVNTGFIRGKKKEKAPEEPKVEAPTQEEVVAEQPEAVEEPIAATPPPAEKEEDNNNNKENLIPPIYTEDYFLHQGLHVSNELPDDIGAGTPPKMEEEEEQSLMVVMSFSEWLMFYKKKKQQEEEEEQDQRELKSMWQKQKLAAAMEEENEEIPENVFEMAVNSIAKEDNLVSESLAEVMVKQGRYERAIDMYKKLSLRKPQKKAYFARRIEEILKEQ